MLEECWARSENTDTRTWDLAYREEASTTTGKVKWRERNCLHDSAAVIIFSVCLIIPLFSLFISKL